MIKLPENPCAICRKNEVTQLCDFVTAYVWTSVHGGIHRTCDLPMCKECAKSHGPFDFCPYHDGLSKKLKVPDKKLIRRKNQYKSKELKELRGNQ
ncbi:hypothetical protein HOO54_23715 [Bacillus sp. WMMC1349]|uniref:hypothetical protein n=1 Tax=Bacillus sp. WMMC1349 TaxID=2736254 RepID=UPI0015520805|nr:hypothetical protein [Bacillus sp. WMMC1349]NPC90998.1 hypothetical protein [Bacillus sp. WMMC1349]NPC91043.1 hypothetical protein [Bacillus sp. WMMC1349]NPC94982.1 hypothetical protein [Bacillus sp. WMMC1349]NPC95030.1 hypothetical protein [Bacillus sp. WMMC1349]NPC95064.1 hypothetical protein [Bacillus sp. WMMC1349]